MKQKVALGEVIKAVGNHPVLGDWDLGKGVALQWQEGNLWNATIDIPVGKPLKFKASADPQCQIHGGRLAWAEGFIAGALWYLAMQPDQGDGGEEVAWAKSRRAPPIPGEAMASASRVGRVRVPVVKPVPGGGVALCMPCITHHAGVDRGIPPSWHRPQK